MAQAASLISKKVNNKKEYMEEQLNLFSKSESQKIAKYSKSWTIKVVNYLSDLVRSGLKKKNMVFEFNIFENNKIDTEEWSFLFEEFKEIQYEDFKNFYNLFMWQKNKKVEFEYIVWAINNRTKKRYIIDWQTKKQYNLSDRSLIITNIILPNSFLNDFTQEKLNSLHNTINDALSEKEYREKYNLLMFTWLKLINNEIELFWKINDIESKKNLLYTEYEKMKEKEKKRLKLLSREERLKERKRIKQENQKKAYKKEALTYSVKESQILADLILAVSSLESKMSNIKTYLSDPKNKINIRHIQGKINKIKKAGNDFDKIMKLTDKQMVFVEILSEEEE